MVIWWELAEDRLVEVVDLMGILLGVGGSTGDDEEVNLTILTLDAFDF